MCVSWMQQKSVKSPLDSTLRFNKKAIISTALKINSITYTLVYYGWQHRFPSPFSRADFKLLKTPDKIISCHLNVSKSYDCAVFAVQG